MAENEDGQERTEQPTEKRLREARERGQVPQSRELATAAVFAGGALGLIALGGWMAGSALEWMRTAMGRIGRGVGASGDLVSVFGDTLVGLLWAVLPLIGVCFLAGFVAPAVMGGIGLRTKALAPDIKRLSPLAGIKRMWGTEGAAELLKSLLRVVIVMGAAALYLKSHAHELLGLIHQPLETAAGHGLSLALGTLVAMAVGLGLLGAADMPYQRWQHRKKLMMTRQELRDELKETDGRPEVKGRIRRMQQELSQRRMMEAVPGADVVLVNPTHYAVALKYSRDMRAPKVLAKGVDEMALRIREVAKQHGVAIVSSPPLARALYRQVELNREIPVSLYAAVAQILSYVYQLRTWRPGRGPAPSVPTIDVPEA